ncbi:MAG TPA: zinc-dependent alcohol dehydrogenase [Candidatus Angelobacter sp.]|nr:zinc-dependent alcohol dehydrogenase [Candidatus Angelobacter sp.]
MKAAVLHEMKKDLVFEEVPRPVLEASDLLIQVEACGVCHSDLHVADGDWPQFAPITKIPLILGHEIAGRVVEKGSAVREFQLGDRVGVPWIYWTCGECEFCREGNENLCTRQKITGVTVDGGFAEFMKAPASHVVRIPEALSAVEAAPLFCAGVTVYRALKQARITPGQRLAIFGIGGLGHLAVQIARELGAEITAIDMTEEKLQLAESLGATTCLNAATTNVAKTLRAKGGVHVALVSSGAKAAYDMAFACVRPTGTLLAVGLPAEKLGFPAIMMAAKEIRIQASAVGTRQDVREVLAMASSGKIRCHVAARPLSEANVVMDEMRQGKISGRIALTFS